VIPHALFVDTGLHGVYPRLLGAERCWGVAQEARHYAGPWPVVAHPPCQLWVNLAASNWARGQRDGKPRPYPAWYPGGDDGDCFASALMACRMWGGVLEHPARSWAWKHFNLLPPLRGGGWSSEGHGATEWVAEVWQSAYEHKAAKATWVLVCWPHSCSPPELDWRRLPGTHQIGWYDRNKPTLSKREASATPEPFARALIDLASRASFLYRT
jgi:hypothetical protein